MIELENSFKVFRKNHKVIEPSNEAIPEEILLKILQLSNYTSSKVFLFQLLEEQEQALENFKSFMNYQFIFVAIAIDEIYQENLASAGYALLLAFLMGPLNYNILKRFDEVCSLSNKSNTPEVEELKRVIKELANE